jgi:surfeit locus 1 family protein
MTAALRFRPSFWPTVIAIPAVIVMLALGTWQVQRMYWKEGLIAERVARTTAEPVALPRAGDDLSAMDYRHTSVTGQFLHDHELYLAARSMRGNPGYHVVTPFRMADGSAVFVDRGWIPLERKDPAHRAEGQVAGTVTLDAVIRLPHAQNWLTPDNDPGKNTWFWVDLPAMATAAGLSGEIAPVYLEAGPAPNPGGFPIGGQTRIDLPNDHLQYAITWYALAVALAVIYVLWHRGRMRPQDARDAEDGPASSLR